MDTTKLRVLYPGNHGNAFATERFVANALEQLGYQVERLNVREHGHDSIVAAAKDGEFDVFLFAKAGWGGSDGSWPEAARGVVKTVEAVRPLVRACVAWHWDLCNPAFSPARFEWQKTVSAAVDLTCLTDGSIVPMLPNAVTLRDGAPDDVDLEFIPDQQIDAVLFCGTLYGQRGDWARAMMRRLGPRFVHVGPGSRGYEPLDIPANTEVTGGQLTRLIRSFRFVCNPPWPFYHGYASDRYMLARAHGGLLIAPTVPGYGDGLVEWEHYLPASTDPENYAHKCAEYLDKHDAGQLETVRQNGVRHARSKTWEVRVTELLSRLAARGLPRTVEAPVAIDEPGDDESIEVESARPPVACLPFPRRAV